MSKKLLPCPCCGGKAKIIEQGSTWNALRRVKYRAQCMECGIMTPEYDAREDAVVAWNRRASEWISCADRSPTREDANKTGQVFVLLDGCIVTYAYWDRVLEMGMVTHWMRMPEPPKDA